MKWNKRENLGQNIRNYENNVNISYFVIIRLFVYFNYNCELQDQEIIRVERCLLLLGIIIRKNCRGVYYPLGNFCIINMLLYK